MNSKWKKPIYFGVAVLEFSKLHMYETYYDKLQYYFGQESLQLRFMDTEFRVECEYKK